MILVKRLFSVSHLGTQDRTFTPAPMTVAASSNEEVNQASFMNRGLVHSLKVAETGGLVLGTYDMEIFARDTFQDEDLLYKATGILPNLDFEDWLPWFSRDDDEGSEFHVRITNNDLRLVDKFHEFFSGLKNWQDSIPIKAKENGYVETALGRRRYLEKILGEDKVDNQIRNFPIQGTASDGFKTALCQLDRKFQELELDAHLVLTVHDEIVVEVREDVVEEAWEMIEDCLKNVFKEIVPEMAFELDMRIADSWGTYLPDCTLY
jgi:hypothetical protein